MKLLGRTIAPAKPAVLVINDWRCPECGAKTATWRRPSRWAGVWECLGDCGASDACEHPSKHVDIVEVPLFPTPDHDQSYEREIYVCDVCYCDIDLFEADPVQDKIEATDDY